MTRPPPPNKENYPARNAVTYSGNRTSSRDAVAAVAVTQCELAHRDDLECQHVCVLPMIFNVLLAGILQSKIAQRNEQMITPISLRV